MTKPHDRDAAEVDPSVPDALAELTRARVRMQVAELDYQRALVRAAQSHSQHEIELAARLSQASVSADLKTARRVAMPEPGQRWASPYEVCQRYAAGELTRDETIQILSTWEYADGSVSREPWDDMMILPEGSIHEVVCASGCNLIDNDMYAAIIEAYAQRPG
ncbi:hypothetical protein [uncultured Corynebacterium sp.]|uniref:hypothetical protein n=1 Tax=uncultured Corynebacterium sp. TaxID=159447 RepID=UPI0025CFE635|nr:hypothetical protein [uncultured Corynebacterium sp.]